MSFIEIPGDDGTTATNVDCSTDLSLETLVPIVCSPHECTSK